MNDLTLAVENYANGSTIDPGMAGIIGAAIAGIVGLVGHFTFVRKTKNEREASIHTGFDKLTQNLQQQITEMKADLKGVHEELTEVKARNSKLALENQSLKAEVQTKNEIIRGFSQWHDLWEQWFKHLTRVLGDDKASKITPPPDYTWQMKQYLNDVRIASQEAQSIMESDSSEG